jgi:hypothetical protein
MSNLRVRVEVRELGGPFRPGWSSTRKLTEFAVQFEMDPLWAPRLDGIIGFRRIILSRNNVSWFERSCLVPPILSQSKIVSQYCPDLFQQCRDVLRRCLPQFIEIHRVVAVNEAVPHACDGTSGCLLRVVDETRFTASPITAI